MRFGITITEKTENKGDPNIGAPGWCVVCGVFVGAEREQTGNKQNTLDTSIRDSNRERERRQAPTDEFVPYLDERSGLGALLEGEAQLVREKVEGRVGGLDVLLDRLER